MDELSIRGARCVRPRGRQGFWRRQFDDAPTPAQRRFDVTFGVLMPVLCLVCDPVVFRGGLMGEGGLYSEYGLYAYTISALEIVALCAWLFAAGRAGRRPAALAGMLLAGGLFSFLVGFAILPYSLFGLLFLLIGALGFVPFLTAFVYLRNGWRAAGAVGRAGQGSPGLAAAALACGFFFALGAPAVAHVSVTSEVAAALEDVREGRELSRERLRALRMAAASGSGIYDELVWEYRREGDPVRRARLAKAYEQVTAGGDIKQRLAILSD
jgi:hypothetical protein